MRPHVREMITLGKRGDVAARVAAAYLMTRDCVDKLFDTISRVMATATADTCARSWRLPQGDGGDIAFVELLGSEKTLDESAEAGRLRTNAPKKTASHGIGRAENKQAAETEAAIEEK